jgi:hypothetical protein
MGGGSSNPHQISGSYSWVDAGCRDSLHRRTNGVGGSGARRCRFRSTGGQRAAPHGDFGNTSIDRSVRVRPGHRGGRRARPQTGRAPRRDIRSPGAAHSSPAAVAQCVEAAAKSGMGRASTRPPPAAVRSPGPTGRCDPWGAVVRGHIAHPSQALAPASRAFRSALNPTGKRYRQFRIISSSPSASAPGGGAVTVQ